MHELVNGSMRPKLKCSAECYNNKPICKCANTVPNPIYNRGRSRGPEADVLGPVRGTMRPVMEREYYCLKWVIDSCNMCNQVFS